MLLMSPEEAAVFEQLDPGTARRLVIGRTGRAFVWDPISSTSEVPMNAARALVAEGIVGANGRIAPEHVELWKQLHLGPVIRKQQRVAPAMHAEPARMPPPKSSFDRTLPLGVSADSLRAMN